MMETHMKKQKSFFRGLPWMALGALVLLVVFFPAFALSKGAPGGLGLWGHLRFGVSYILTNPRSSLSFGLLCPGLGALVGWLGYKKALRPRLPEVLLAAFFSVNILIGLTSDRRIIRLVALPGLDGTENILLWAGLLLSVSSLVHLAVRWLTAPLAPKDRGLSYSGRRKWLWAAVTLLCWVPVILLRAPGGLMWDTNTQIRSFQGTEIMNASHPLLTTFFYGGLYTLGQLLCCDDLGIVLCVLPQAALTLYAVAMLADEVTVCRQDTRPGLGVSLFFGLVSVFPMFVMMGLRDSLFGPLYLLFALYYRRLLLQSSKRDLVWLLVLGFLCAATRKGAIYLVILSILALLLYRKPLRKVLCAAALGLLAVHWAVILVLCPALNIVPPAEYENYSPFYYITGYYCQHYAQDLTEEEIAVISDVLDYDAVLHKFNPDQNNDIKYTFHAESSQQVRRYLALNVQFFLRHPLTVLEAMVYSRCDYFLPLYSGSENIMGKMGPAWLDGPALEHWDGALWDLNMRSPLRALNFSGLYNWLCLLLAVAALESKHSIKKMLCLPALMMTLGLLTTHTNGAVRYALPVLYCVPMLLVLFRATEGAQPNAS